MPNSDLGKARDDLLEAYIGWKINVRSLEQARDAFDVFVEARKGEEEPLDQVFDPCKQCLYKFDVTLCLKCTDYHRHLAAVLAKKLLDT